MDGRIDGWMDGETLSSLCFSVLICGPASMKVWKYGNMEVCKYGIMQVWNYASIQVCKYASIEELKD